MCVCVRVFVCLCEGVYACVERVSALCACVLVVYVSVCVGVCVSVRTKYFVGYLPEMCVGAFSHV